MQIIIADDALRDGDADGVADGVPARVAEQHRQRNLLVHQLLREHAAAARRRVDDDGGDMRVDVFLQLIHERMDRSLRARGAGEHKDVEVGVPLRRRLDRHVDRAEVLFQIFAQRFDVVIIRRLVRAAAVIERARRDLPRRKVARQPRDAHHPQLVGAGVQRRLLAKQRTDIADFVRLDGVAGRGIVHADEEIRQLVASVAQQTVD